MSMSSRVPSTARVLRGAVIAVFVLLFVWKTLSVDLLIFAGIVLAVALGKAAETIGRRSRLSYPLSLVLVVVSLVIAGGAILWFFAQALIDQFQQLTLLLGHATTMLQQRFPGIWDRLFVQTFSGAELSTAFDGLFGAFSSAVMVAGAVIVVVFFALYLSAEPKLYERGLVSLVPLAQREKVRDLLALLAEILWYWMLGRLFSITVIGVATTVGLWALGIPAPLALGILAAALALIPYLGAIAAALPGLLLAFTVDMRHALYVLALYIGIHVLEGYILIPLVQRKASHVPPALTLASELVMGVLAGLLGLLLAMPLTAALIPVIRQLYVEDVLGGRTTSSDAIATERGGHNLDRKSRSAR